MTDNSYKNISNFSDKAIEHEIGTYIKSIRKQQNKTQIELANAANISRSTLSLLENGESGSLKTLIQVLRILDKLDTLSVFNYQEPLSPLLLAKAQHKTRERVRSSKKKITSEKNNTNW